MAVSCNAFVTQAQHKVSGQPKGAHGHQVDEIKQGWDLDGIFYRFKSRQAFINSCHGSQRWVPVVPSIVLEGVDQLSRIAHLNLWAHPCPRPASDEHPRETNSPSHGQTNITPSPAVLVFLPASPVWKFNPRSNVSNPCFSFKFWRSKHTARNFNEGIWLYSWCWICWQIVGGKTVINNKNFFVYWKFGKCSWLYL